MRTKKRYEKRNGFLLLGMVLAALLFGSGTAVRALESEKSTEIRSVHVQDGQIEEATLVIGSHLIHLNALTDELYQIALDSANEFNQTGMYYKSELAGGTWYEISEATSIKDITTAGTPVSSDVIEALEFTHQTKSDGITIDLRTGAAVSVYDIKNPYDLRAMEELEPLLLQYQILCEKTDKNKSDEIYLKLLETFFAEDIQSDVTRDCDTSLKALETYQKGLSSREKPAQWTEETGKTISSVDADRRVDSLTTLEILLDMLENDASGMKQEEAGTEASSEESTPADFVINSEIVSAVGDCIQNVQESISTYTAKQITGEGDSVSAKMEYQYRQALIAGARKGSNPDCDSALEKLCNLENILNGVVAQGESEQDTLASELIGTAYTDYAKALKAGASQEYRNQKAKGASQAVLKQCLSQQKTEANTKRLEYQTMLDALFIRMKNEEAQKYALQLISGVADLEDLVVQDAAAPYLRDTVAEHLIWLRGKYAELVKNASDSTAMSALEQEKEKLEQQYQNALDQNDLAQAKKIKTEMEASQKNMDRLAAELSAVLNDENSSEAEKAQAAASLGEKNTAALLISMADDLTEAIRGADSETSATDLQNQMTALTAAATLNPEAAKAALQQVQEALENAAELSKELKEELSEEVEEALETAKTAAETTAAVGTAGQTQTSLETLLDSVLTDLFGGGFSELSEKQQAAAMIAMEWYGEREEQEAALQLAATLAEQANEQKNPYLYRQYTDRTGDYLSLQALGLVSGYRYIFDDAHVTVTLQKGKRYYRFTVSRLTCETAEDTERELSAKPVWAQSMYLSGTDSRQIFDTEAENFEKTALGAVGTPEVEALAEDIYEELRKGGD